MLYAVNLRKNDIRLMELLLLIRIYIQKDFCSPCNNKNKQDDLQNPFLLF